MWSPTYTDKLLYCTSSPTTQEMLHRQARSLLSSTHSATDMFHFFLKSCCPQSNRKQRWNLFGKKQMWKSNRFPHDCLTSVCIYVMKTSTTDRTPPMIGSKKTPPMTILPPTPKFKIFIFLNI